MGATNQEQYEVVIGLEVHAQLLTDSKLFSGDSASFGGEPNTHVSPITLALPGTLPRLNRKAIEYAIRMGFACNSEIERKNFFARKHYFYPDLPKGYQITQHETPICKGGHVNINTSEGPKTIRLNHIHLEEDAGKSMHNAEDAYSSVDFNRAGVPLIEIVSEPDLRSGEDAFIYISELRKMVRFLGICDGNMEEGSMRCDANISVRKKGETRLGTKVEVKNLNSMRNVRKAIEFESERMIEMLENGQIIIQQTRSFDADSGITFSLRTKEEANDYRYFTDPDLPAFIVTDELLERIRENQPELPEKLAIRYVEQFRLSDYDARQIADDRSIAEYFEHMVKYSSNYKGIANLLLGPVRSILNDLKKDFGELEIPPESMAVIIKLVDEGQINFSMASSRLLPALFKEPLKAPSGLIVELNLNQVSNSGQVNEWVEAALNNLPEKVAEYRKGKKGLIGLFVGEVKKISRGKADPKLVNDILLEKLNQ